MTTIPRWRAVRCAIPLVMAMGLVQGASAASPERYELLESDRPIFKQNTMAAREKREVEVFVRLDEPAVTEYVRRELQSTQSMPGEPAQQSQYRAVMQQQADVRQRLRGYDARILSALQVGANGFRVRVPADRIGELRDMPGVVSVAPVVHHTPHLADSVPWINAPAVHDEFGDGEGVTVAVIDTGIDYTHADFGGSGDPADFAGNDPDIIEPGTFPTAKVVDGFDFAGTDFDAGSDDPAENTPNPDPDPIDEAFHGTHVAGAVAGIGVDGEVGQGVAPGASLMALKVFGESGSTNLTSDAIEYALDPNGDGSIDDRADVINLSLGSFFGNPGDPSAIAAQNATELGVVVVASAGNSGDVPYVTGSPAVAPGVISVAASVPGNRTQSRFEVTAPSSLAGVYDSLEGTGPVKLEDVGPISGDMAAAEPLEACSGLTNPAAVAGKIALVIRGSCTFDTKYLNVQAAGAEAIVVYNDGTAPDRMDPIVMGGISSAVTIPGVMIGFDAGDAIRTELDGGGTVSATLSAVPNDDRADTMAGFSSRGPGHGGSTFKPDVTAPGSGIVSAFFGSGTGGVASSGTSFSAPHVAGLAALLRSIHPAMEPAGIKALIQNSAVPGHSDGLGGENAYPLARQGTGIVRADRAARLGTVALPGGVAFGRVDPVYHAFERRTVTVRNLTDRFRFLHVRHEPNQTVPGVSVRHLGSGFVFLPPHGERTLRLSLSMDPSRADADDNLYSQREVDGWFVLTDGLEETRIGYTGVVDPSSRVAAHRGFRGVRLFNTGFTEGDAEAFSFVARDGALLDDRPNAIDTFGFRTLDPATAGFPGIEFGVSTEVPWETPAAYEIDINIDADEDGVFETTLIAVDLGLITGTDPTGELVTVIFSPDAAALLFDARADLNDGTAVLPFCLTDCFGLPYGFLEPGDTGFDYQLAMFDIRSGEVDVQTGRVELDGETKAVPASTTVAPFGHQRVDTQGSGELLWFFPDNRPAEQAATVRVR